MREFKNGKLPMNPVEMVRQWGDGRTEKFTYTGLTKREYFVAMAMQGLLAAGRERDAIAEYAISYADDVLEQLEILERLEK